MTEQTNNISNKPVRVRFAPSPTGKLHIGGARTAIYNWAFARATGGTFVLRIEDTDPERSTKENTELILRAMDWMGLTWDEGPQVGGPYGPYFQTQRMDTYKKALEVLKEKDAVYPCFCTKEELEAKRKLAEEKEGGYSGYDRTCRHLNREEAEARIAAGEPHVWRLKVPLDHGPVEFNDAVYGPMSFPIDVMDDMVVVRTDGTPTYNFAVVCDDVNMQMTHIIRGDDHLSNTPRQILIYEALGAPLPTFAHLSMILGPDGKKLSKRHGATSVEEYRDRGYLPDALVNFLALLGWSLDGETTIISREELCSSFSLDRITKKDAIFDETKLNWMNGVYMRELSPEAWFDLSVPWLAKAVAEGERIAPGVTVLPTPEETFAETPAAPVADAIEKADEAVQESEQLNTTEAEDIFDTEMGAKSEDPFPEEVDVHSFESLATIEEDIRANADFYQRIYPLIIERLERLDQIPEKLAYLFWGPNIELDPKSVQKVLLKDGSRADEALKACRNVLADESIPWEAEPLQEACRALCEPLELKPKLLFQPLRVAVCGNMVSPPLFESIELMQRSDVIDRIDSVISHFFA